MVAAQLLWLYCNLVLQLLLPLAVGTIPGQDKSQVMHRWAEWDLLREQTLLQISQLPSWRYSGALCTCQQQEVGFLLCCVCNESKWKGTYWISSNSLDSPSGPQDNEHDFLSYWALPSLDFCYFSDYFFLNTLSYERCSPRTMMGICIFIYDFVNQRLGDRKWKLLS